MKRLLQFVAPALALVTSVCYGAQTASTSTADLPVISIAQIDARDADIYAAQIAAINAVMKSKLNADSFLRLYLGDAAGADSGSVFAVSRADSFAALSEALRVYQMDPDLVVLRTSLDAVRKLGPRTLLKAVRFDGGYGPAWLYNTFANVSDEAGYLQALADLASQLKSRGFEDARINVYRVIAGRSDYTHLISFNMSSSERLAALLDAVANEPWVAEWIAASARYRTVVRNGTYREITR